MRSARGLLAAADAMLLSRADSALIAVGGFGTLGQDTDPPAADNLTGLEKADVW